MEPEEVRPDSANDSSSTTQNPKLKRGNSAVGSIASSKVGFCWGVGVLDGSWKDLSWIIFGSFFLNFKLTPPIMVSGVGFQP